MGISFPAKPHLPLPSLFLLLLLLLLYHLHLLLLAVLFYLHHALQCVVYAHSLSIGLKISGEQEARLFEIICLSKSAAFTYADFVVSIRLIQ